VSWYQPLAAGGEQQSAQQRQATPVGGHRCALFLGGLGQHVVGGLLLGAGQDRWMLAGVVAALVHDLAEVHAVVQGDNLHALKALLPRYAGQVKCIYIDPPYNTGNEGWVYNDNVNSPEIRKWLGEVVGKEGETLDRHDRWLSMMYPRLVLLKQFLRDDGFIFVSLDDNEIATFKILLAEIFGEKNFVAQIIVEANRRGQTYKQNIKNTRILTLFSEERLSGTE
jgi:hypothetical protein